MIVRLLYEKQLKVCLCPLTKQAPFPLPEMSFLEQGDSTSWPSPAMTTSTEISLGEQRTKVSRWKSQEDVEERELPGLEGWAGQARVGTCTPQPERPQCYLHNAPGVAHPRTLALPPGLLLSAQPQAASVPGVASRQSLQAGNQQTGHDGEHGSLGVLQEVECTVSLRGHHWEIGAQA